MDAARFEPPLECLVRANQANFVVTLEVVRS